MSSQGRVDGHGRERQSLEIVRVGTITFLLLGCIYSHVGFFFILSSFELGIGHSPYAKLAFSATFCNDMTKEFYFIFLNNNHSP